MTTLTKEALQQNAASNLKHARKELGLTQKVFATEINTTREVIGAIEEGRSYPTVEHVYRLSRLINVSIDTLYLQKLNA